MMLSAPRCVPRAAVAAAGALWAPVRRACSVYAAAARLRLERGPAPPAATTGRALAGGSTNPRHLAFLPLRIAKRQKPCAFPVFLRAVLKKRLTKRRFYARVEHILLVLC